MSFWDDYMLMQGWSARSAATPTSQADVLKLEGQLVTQLTNLEKGINRDFSRERIAQLKQATKIRSDRIKAETDLAKVDVTDRNGVRRAMAQMHAALTQTEDDIEQTATHKNEALLDASTAAYGRGGTGAGFNAFLDNRSGTAASPGSRLSTKQTTNTWETLVEDIGDDKVRITEDGNIEIAEGTGMSPGLIARIQRFHTEQYQPFKQNQITLLGDVRSDIASIDAEMENVNRAKGDAEVSAALGRVQSLAKAANSAIDASPIASGEMAAEELNAFYEQTKLQQMMMTRLEELQSTAGGDPKRALLKQFVGRDAAQQWAKDRGLSIGYVDDAGNYVAGRHDMRAAMQFGWETTRGVAEGGKQARYGVGMRRPTDEWVRVTTGYSPEDQETFRHSDGGYVMRDGRPAAEAELAERGLVPTFYRLDESFTLPLEIVDPLFVDNEGRWYEVSEEGNYVQITDRRTAIWLDAAYYGADDAGNPLYDNESLASKEPVVIRDSVTEKLRYMRPEEGANIAAVDESGRPLFVHEDIPADEAAKLVNGDNNLELRDTLPATREVRGRRLHMHAADLAKYGAGARRIRNEITGQEEIVDINDPTVTYQVTAEEPLGVTGFPSSVKTERDVRVRARRDEARRRREELGPELAAEYEAEAEPSDVPEQTWQRRALEKLFGVVRPERGVKGVRTEYREPEEEPTETTELLDTAVEDADLEMAEAQATAEKTVTDLLAAYEGAGDAARKDIELQLSALQQAGFIPEGLSEEVANVLLPAEVVDEAPEAVAEQPWAADGPIGYAYYRSGPDTLFTYDPHSWERREDGVLMFREEGKTVVKRGDASFDDIDQRLTDLGVPAGPAPEAAPEIAKEVEPEPVEEPSDVPAVSVDPPTEIAEALEAKEQRRQDLEEMGQELASDVDLASAEADAIDLSPPEQEEPSKVPTRKEQPGAKKRARQAKLSEKQRKRAATAMKKHAKEAGRVSTRRKAGKMVPLTRLKELEKRAGVAEETEAPEAEMSEVSAPPEALVAPTKFARYMEGLDRLAPKAKKDEDESTSVV